jgi:hypothetical protein
MRAAFRAAASEPDDLPDAGATVEFKSPPDFRGFALGKLLGYQNDEYGLWAVVDAGSGDIFEVPHAWVRRPLPTKRRK